LTGPKKKRLDLLLVEQKLAESIDWARRLIGSGQVFIDHRVCDKAGSLVAADSLITLKAVKRFVSRGGDKLAAGLQGLKIDPKGFICADIGASTGGFTDCLLQFGARKVYSVDVGYGLLDWKLRQDERVVVLERLNARYLGVDHIPENIDLAVIDASFISLEPLLAPLLRFFQSTIRILALVKPQFQLPRDKIGPGGIVCDELLHQQALDMVQQFGIDLGLQCAGVIASPVLGMKGNQEFFMLLSGPSKVEIDGTEKLEQGDYDEVSKNK
jgi:23S rRNA (cytidine1920-2'-O)/16S rRNA (cytidine1409-2'-O)-methyltransferase